MLLGIASSERIVQASLERLLVEAGTSGFTRNLKLTRDAARVDLLELIDLFYDHPTAVGEFEEVAAEEIPPTTRSLLDHHQHMTVTVERFHRCPVAVRVLQTKRQGSWYAREILLEGTSPLGNATTGNVVQYGIVRLHVELLAEPVRSEILAGQKPLGRVLIEHDVLRSVRLLSLQRILPGPVLQQHFGIRPGEPCYGRTAIIFCDDLPAIQLLEVVPDVG